MYRRVLHLHSVKYIMVLCACTRRARPYVYVGRQEEARRSGWVTAPGSPIYTFGGEMRAAVL